MHNPTSRPVRVAVALTLLVTSFLWPAGTVHAAAGDLDPSFSGGFVTTDPTGFSDAINTMVAQADGKIVVGGQATDTYTSGPFVLARYNSDGSLDTSFGNSGIATVDIGTGWSLLNAMAVQPDDKIVAAGMFYDSTDASRVFALARFCPDGSLDTGANCPALLPKFGANGIVTTQVSPGTNTSYAQAVALQPDGKIVAGGLGDPGGRHEFALVRYNPDGSLDTSFGGDGVVTASTDGGDPGWESAEIYALTMIPDGRIVGTGFASTPESLGDNRLAVARYCPDGSLDTGTNCPTLAPKFGTNGTVVASLSSNPDAIASTGWALTPQSDGKLVVAGCETNDYYECITYLAARYLPDGSLDPGFGVNGVATGQLDSILGTGEARAIQLDAEGRILLGGAGMDPITYDYYAAVARLCPDGSLDAGGTCSAAGFGVNGVVSRPFGDTPSYVRALTLLSDGRPVAAGRANPGSGNVFALSRFLADPPSNAAPSLDASKTPLLTAINQTQSAAPTSGSTAGSSLVSQLIDSGGVLDNFSDTDGDPAGLAITGLGGSGTWWFTTDSGANWISISGISATNALLLSADAGTRLYYQNGGGSFHGLIDPAVTFRAWDGSSGAAGDTANPGAGGGTSAFSSDSDSAQLQVTDNVAATVTSVTVPANGWYVADHNLDFTVSFSENVTVNTSGGAPQLNLTIGISTAPAMYISGSGSRSIVFRYTVTEGNIDVDGIAIGAAISLNGSTIRDAAGNNASTTLNSVGSTSQVRVDGISPDAPTITAPGADALIADATPTVTGTAEANSTVTLYIDGSAVGTGSADGSGNWAIAPVSALGQGVHQAYATATDPAGNTSAASATISFTVDSEPPGVASMLRMDASPTLSAQVRFQVTFDEAITGLSVDHFSLSTSGVTGASIATLSGSGNTYVVTVNSGSGSGSVGLNLVDNSGIVDQAGNGLPETPVTGPVYVLDRTASLALHAAPQPSIYGQPVSITATVTATLGVPGGQVSFSDNGETIGQAALDAEGVAAVQLTLPIAGTHVFTATYAGDATFGPAAGEPLSHTVQQAAPAVDLISSSNPAPRGQAVTLTARLTHGSLAPTGVVTFTVDGIQAGVRTLVDGTASLTTSTLAVGSHAIELVYGGDSNFQPGSTTLSQVIGKNLAVVSLSGLSQTYSGKPRQVAASTDPAGLQLVVTYDGSTTAPSGAGTYAVQATVSDPDYAGTAVGTLVIAKASLSVIAENQVRRTGQANPPLAYHYAGFVNQETAAVLSGTPMVSTVATSGSPAGLYPITVVTGTLSSQNYRFLLFNAGLTVHAPPVVAQPLRDAGAIVRQPFLFTIPSGTFTDADPADTLTYRATLADGRALPAWLVFSPAARTFAGTPAQAVLLSIRVTATDSWGDTATDEFAMLVESPPASTTNHPPLVVDDTIETSADTPATINLLDNDSDPDGDGLRVQSVSPLAHGTLAFTADGQLVYTPNPLFSGVETAVYTVSDDRGGLVQGVVTVTTHALPPRAFGVHDAAATQQNLPVDIPVLQNDILSSGTTGSISGIQQMPQHGTATVNPNGTVTYTPTTGFTGSDTFSYWLAQSAFRSLGAADARSAAESPIEVPVTVIVGHVEDDAVAMADSATTDENQALVIDALANDAVSEGTKRLLGIDAQPEHGRVVIQGDGTLLYTPEPYFNGADTFTYSMGNGLLGHASATVSVTVRAVNQLPIAVTDTAWVLAGDTVSIDVLANDSDAEDGKPDLLDVNPAQHGITEVKDGQVTYTPDADFEGEDRFLYTVQDSTGDMSFGLVTVRVTQSQFLYYFPQTPVGAVLP